MESEQLREVVRRESIELAAMQQRLHDAGLHQSGHAVNAVSQRLGWEAERLLTKLGVAKSPQNLKALEVGDHVRLTGWGEHGFGKSQPDLSALVLSGSLSGVVESFDSKGHAVIRLDKPRPGRDPLFTDHIDAAIFYPKERDQ